MADRSHGGAEGDAEDAELSDNNVFGLRRDHCDILLDEIDTQLGRLQVQPLKHQTISTKCDCSVSAAPLRWTQSMSKDTGFGSSSQTNDTPMSCLDLIHTPTIEHISEETIVWWADPAMHEETKKRLDRRTRDKEEKDSQREQVIWRLERLLGDACKENEIAGEMQPPSDSVCTEDFVRRFRDEMVELAFPESNIQQLDTEEERTDISDSDTYDENEQKGQSALDVEKRGSATTGGSSKVTMTVHYSQSKNKREELEKCFSDHHGVNILHIKEKAGAEQRSPQRINNICSSIAHKAEDVMEHEKLQYKHLCLDKIRCLAGVPVTSFDAVSIDSDLDSDCTEQVRQHIHRQPGWHAIIQSATGIDDYCIYQSDTAIQEEGEPHSTLGPRSTDGGKQNRSTAVCQRSHSKREPYRLVSYFGDNIRDEETKPRNRKCKTERKMQSVRAKMKEQLFNIQQKCEKEEETLRIKRAQLKDVELCLSEFRHRRKHALQELEQLAAERAQMEKEKRTLECVLSDSRIERDSISCQLQNLQKQRESCVLEDRDMEEELVTVSQHKHSLMERNSIIMSVLEREEMERQLDNAKTDLFAEQRRAREKLESMQERLEETCEELQRATEAESSLKNKCACLEEKQMQKKKHIEAFEAQVCELQVELGKCQMRKDTLEKTLAQKELELTDFQEHHRALETERNGLKEELQHLKTEHYKTLKDAQHQAQQTIVNQQAEEMKVSALKDQTLFLTRRTESMQSSIKLKEEEAKQLRKSLEQQREEAKNREEELHIEALEKVHQAMEEERRKWEAEKVEAVQVQRRILEEENRKSLESMTSVMQQEKSKALALQHELSELKTKTKELESKCCAQQKEHASLLAVICKSLKEEHQTKLQRLKNQMAQESQQTVLQLEQGVHLAEKKADRLRVMLDERESSHKQITEELDKQLRNWAQELGAECQHLYLLVEQCGTKHNSMQLPPSPSVAEALTNLKTLREHLKLLISQLHQELESQKRTTEQLRTDKERELNIQRHQLRMERDQALDFLKERLIQEHIEDLSSINWTHVSSGGAEGGGVAASLRKQLKAKDLELRQVQRNMGQWKEQTAARLACKFEEELTAELERKASRIQTERQRTSVGPEGHMSALHVSDAQNSFCSPSFLAVDSAASYNSSDVSSFKLLCYLQSRVKQLRVENQAYISSPSPSDTVSLDLPRSCLTAITQGQDIAGIQSQ